MQKPSCLLTFAALIASACISAPDASAQQAYPTKPIRVIVPLGAGGVPDVFTRTLGKVFQERTGQPLIVDNRPGANTQIGAEACASAAADGYTLCVLSASTMSTNPVLYAKLRYSPESFAPITNLIALDLLMAAHPKVTAGSLQDLVGYSKANPGKLNYASFGVGSDVHLVMDWVRRTAGVEMTHISFNGFPPIMQALGSGDIQIIMVGLGNPGIVDMVKAGRVKPIALHAPKRSPLLPDVRTFSEAGLPKLEAFTWFGLFAPAGTPDSILRTLNSEVDAAMNSPALAERVGIFAVTPMNGTAAEFSKFLAKDRIVWGELVKSAGAKIE